MLDEALGRLSPVQRQAVSLRLRGVADVDGIAARLGLSTDTVRASLAFAVAQLRMALSDAPLDRKHNDWLYRCRVLLTAPAAAPPAPPSETRAAAAVHAVHPAPVQAAPAAKAPGLRRHLPVLLGGLALIAAGMLAWQTWKPVPDMSPPIDAGPLLMPPPTAPEAPLTAPDFLLVLMQQQHPDVLENLEFHVWLAEQEALP